MYYKLKETGNLKRVQQYTLYLTLSRFPSYFLHTFFPVEEPVCRLLHSSPVCWSSPQSGILETVLETVPRDPIDFSNEQLSQFVVVVVIVVVVVFQTDSFLAFLLSLKSRPRNHFPDIYKKRRELGVVSHT